ncbi:unnamed protein product [Paramecium sonneborni]|uniref:Transmembrane protein n=1 Tax=Paramecium sonneborni TaxID=65129 RepID=A0A8S1NJ87_9CILI|nr:unnamed protein product [Paramecium sonneborni]
MDCNNFLNDKEILKDQDQIQQIINTITINKHLFKEDLILDLNAVLGLIPILLIRLWVKSDLAMKSHDHVHKIIISKITENVSLKIKKELKKYFQIVNNCKRQITKLRWTFIIFERIIVSLVQEQQLIFAFFPLKSDSFYDINIKCMQQQIIKQEPLLESTRMIYYILILFQSMKLIY